MRWYLCLFAALIIQVRAVAWETDQFTLSDQPIADIGVDVSSYVFITLQNTLKKVSYIKATYPTEIARLELLLNKSKKDFGKFNNLFASNEIRWQTQHLRQSISELESTIRESRRLLALAQTEQGMTELISLAIGRQIAIDEKRDSIWRGTPEFIDYPSGFKQGAAIAYQPDRFDTIYAFAGFHRLLHPSHFIFSSTVKLYDIEMGMDKLGHLFNEGFQYYQYFISAKSKGGSHSKALNKAVEWGIETERSYYGLWVSGIYSNADLASNYAGLHFYINLFSELHLNGVTYTPILRRDEMGQYQINDNSDNQPNTLLNEAAMRQKNKFK